MNFIALLKRLIENFRDKRRCSPIKETAATSRRQAAIDMMIEERKAISPEYKSPKMKEKEQTERENVWEARKNEALLDAANIERGILKDILFSETTSNVWRWGEPKNLGDWLINNAFMRQILNQLTFPLAPHNKICCRKS